MRPDGFFDEYLVGFTDLRVHHTYSNVYPYYRFYSVELHGSPADEFFKFVKVNIREFPDLQRLLGVRIHLEAKGCYDLWDLNQADL